MNERVFICSPYRGGGGNISTNATIARRLCRLAVELGHTPVAPHLYFPQFLSDKDPNERELGLECALRWLKCCQFVWAYIPPGGPTEGMRLELATASAAGLLIVDIHDVATFIQRSRLGAK